MNRLLSVQSTTYILLVALGLLGLFHVLLLCGIIPWRVVWGGRLESASQMHIFEAVALVVTAFMIWVVAMRGGLIKPLLPPWAIYWQTFRWSA